MATTFMVANQKGGVGKTTTSHDLATALCNLKKRVLLIDLDQQCNLTTYVGADVNYPSISEALHGEKSVEEITQHLAYFDFIAASPALSRADREFIDQDDIFLLSDVVDLCQHLYDYILIDCGPTRNILLSMAYIAVDYVLIPTECDDGSLDGIRAINQDLVKLRNSRLQLTHARVFGVILNKVEKTALHATTLEILDNMCKELDNEAKVYQVRKSIGVSECKKFGQAMQEYNRTGNVAKDFRYIANQIVKRCDNAK